MALAGRIGQEDRSDQRAALADTDTGAASTPMPLTSAS